MVSGKPTNAKLRKTIISKFCKGKSFRKIAADGGISWTTVQGIVEHFGKMVIIKIAGKSSGRPVTITERNGKLLIKICKKSRRSSMRGITSQRNNRTGLDVS